MLTRLLNNFLTGAIIAIVIASTPLFAGAPVGELVGSMQMVDLGSHTWHGQGDVTVTEITDCYGPSVPVRADLAPNPPYAQYTVIADFVHGCDYNHAAIDFLAVGDDTVLSPINGCVTANTYDGVWNTVLKIENDQYIVTMLHGDYIVLPGDCVRRGQKVGNDASNGKSSTPHTHLSVFDKLVGHNAHPMALIK